ncbi:RNA 2',3'-cyclic phosphodiesterase [Citrobacter sp. JGM124]|uniref:RNA 2',3'-cyclic phosphodiesterase n=1 Tax=Citrobacter sp. JGM124 TaxID=2799789 RepID=UPI001BA47E0C|nr:RNA 2',3'-cyclic phosphodiesterase [Citrobacter sp. JGM124]MBS0848516.1 RNA 2',3'-cyclic phosphodiesterase [Citrobacter sp. JGM124]
MAETRRLFFALALPESIQSGLISWRAAHFSQSAGRPVVQSHLHLTLAFLGEVSADKQKALSQLAGRIAQPAFTLRLDDAGQWLRSGVVWVGPRHAPRGLLQLADMLRAQAARSGCYQAPLPFHPHITLYRNASQPVALPPPGFGWSFPVNEFALYASIFKKGQTEYRVLEKWPLSDSRT